MYDAIARRCFGSSTVAFRVRLKVGICVGYASDATVRKYVSRTPPVHWADLRFWIPAPLELDGTCGGGRSFVEGIA